MQGQIYNTGGERHALLVLFNEWKASLHKKCFLLRISLENVNKSAENYRFDHIH